MGQYQQWLRYQKIDQSLHTTREALEAELAQCEGQLDLVFFEQLTHESVDDSDSSSLSTESSPSTTHTLASNTIVAALLTCLPAENGMSTRGYVEQAEIYFEEQPDSGAPEMPLPAFPSAWDEQFLGEMDGYFDAQFMSTMTDPQLELPWWLRKITDSQSGIEGVSKTDSGSARTNRLVQRWIDRWGRQATYQESYKEEDEGRSHAS